MDGKLRARSTGSTDILVNKDVNELTDTVAVSSLILLLAAHTKHHRAVSFNTRIILFKMLKVKYSHRSTVIDLVK